MITMETKKISIKVGGKEYPCYPTMGAMLRFKDATGREASQMTNSLSDMATYLWACVTSACNRENKDFGMTLQDFADAIDTEEMESWINSFSDVEEEGTESKKK